MKLLYVSGDGDYDALEFEREFEGKLVSDIITLVFDDDVDYESDFDFELFEFEDIDPNFIQFVRNYIQDYDHAKAANFYFENQTI